MKKLLTIAFFALFNPAIFVSAIPLSHVGNPGNTDDATGYGSVGYHYHIGTYEVTNEQYAIFLNSIATADQKSLWDYRMKIERNGSFGEYIYQVVEGLENHPVRYVTYFSALRFCNWLHNGRPDGIQDASSTEDGAYTFTAKYVSSGRNVGALVFLPNEDEWYKAAYYQPTSAGGPPSEYWNYPTLTNSEPPDDPNLPGSTYDLRSARDNSYNTAEVGSYSLSPGPWGTFDQGGNIHEMLEEPGYSRGGSFNDNPFRMEKDDRNWIGFSLTEGTYSSTIGFRIASSSSLIPNKNNREIVLFQPVIKTAVSISWNTSIGKNYQIEKSQNLKEWEPLPEVIEGTGGEVIRFFDITDSDSFYRISEN